MERKDYPSDEAIKHMNRTQAVNLALVLLHILFDPATPVPTPVPQPTGTPPDTSTLIYLDGKPFTFDEFQEAYKSIEWRRAHPDVGYRFITAMFKEIDAPHPYVQWSQGVPLWNVGTNDNWIQKYEHDFKAMWQNAEPSASEGKADFDFVVRQIPLGEAAFKASLKKLVHSEWGVAWLANPLTVGMRPSEAAIKALG